jgi:hypothetical protein
MDDILRRFGINKAPERAAQRLIQYLLTLWRFCGIIRRELQTGQPLPLRDTIRAWRYGFTRWSYFLYQLDRHNPRLYINDLVQAIGMSDINGLHAPAGNQKVVFSRYIEALGGPCPCTHALIMRGRIQLINNQNETGIQWLFNRMDTYRPGVVLKPIIGCEGFGVTFLQYTEAGFLLNGQAASKAEIESVVERLDHYFITDLVVQHEYAAGLYPRTTNTIRLLTLWDYDLDRPFLAASVQRIGTARSYPVDNFKTGLGGLCACIDPETGILACGVYRSDAGLIEPLDQHPETGNPIKGVQVPNWKETVADILRFSTRMPYLPLIGWDVVMTQDGYKIIETNPGSGLFVIQATMPLLADQRVRRFLEIHHCLKSKS